MTSTSSSRSSSRNAANDRSSGGLRTVWRAAPAAGLVFVLAATLAGCSGSGDSPSEEVVVYTALDQVFSEPVLQQFEKQTGIRVRAVYDAESAKTTGLVNRLIARRDHPDCDVFWNNELVQTERLAQLGLLAEYRSPQAERFDARFRDPAGRWTAFAARMRVIIYNTEVVAAGDVPRSLGDLALPAWRGRTAIARPFFGTTLTHMAVLHQVWGPERLADYLKSLRANDVALCTGNAVVARMVASGERAFGLTDTDDAHGTALDGHPVAATIPDADQGAVLIPNTVALVVGCPHPEAGRKLIDFLLSAEVERRLAKGRSAQIPLASDQRDVKTPWDGLFDPAKVMPFDVSCVAAGIPDVVDLLKQEGMDQ